MRVLVTGGAGYVGSVSVERLLEAGHEVTVLDSLVTGHGSSVSAGAERVVGSIGDRSVVGPLLRRRGVQAVLHCAARSLVAESVREPELYERENVIGGRAFIDELATAGVDRLVFSSTAAVYGMPDELPITEATPTRPINANSLYLFQTMDFACDIDQADYQSAISSQMNFSMYLQSDAGSPALREPIPLVKYYNTIPYILNILGTELLGEAYQNSSGVSPAQGYSFNRLLGDVNGTLTQTPTLLGKASITATLVISNPVSVISLRVPVGAPVRLCQPPINTAATTRPSQM
jgi:NAD(P)-dependent dehydrogenase (short-subunit alcohol dehydrogenase family)